MTVCDQELSLAPTYRSIEAITRRLDKGTHALLMRFATGDPRHVDMLAIVEEGLRGAGHLGSNGVKPRFTSDQIAEDIVFNFNRYLGPTLEFLTNCNGGTSKNVESQGEESPN